MGEYAEKLEAWKRAVRENWTVEDIDRALREREMVLVHPADVAALEERLARCEEALRTTRVVLAHDGVEEAVGDQIGMGGHVAMRDLWMKLDAALADGACEGEEGGDA